MLYCPLIEPLNTAEGIEKYTVFTLNIGTPILTIPVLKLKKKKTQKTSILLPVAVSKIMLDEWQTV